MKPYFASFLNSLVLIVLGFWGYISSDTPSVTALIPVFAGIVLLILTPWFKKGNKIIAHVAVGITLLILIAFIKPLSGAIGRNDTLAIVRVSVMMVTSFLVMLVFVKSFIDARVKR